MAELINKLDSLNTGREKINQSIQDAEDAKTIASDAESTAQGAVNTANEAKQQASNTQNQLDTVIIESGTSDAETIQARTNERGKQFDILKDRLDNLDVEFEQRGVNVKWFGASGSDQSTTGSIASGSNELTVANAIDFEVGQGILIEGAGPGGVAEVAELQITSSPTNDGQVVITLDGIATNVTVDNGEFETASLEVTEAPTLAGNIIVTLDGVSTNIAVDPAIETTAEAVADKIRVTSFTGWTTGGTTGTTTVIFTANAVGDKTDAVYDDNGTGATGTMTTTTQGYDADTAIEIADNIRNTSFAGWTTGGTAGTDTVTFTSDTVGTKQNATFNANGTGVSGVMTTTTEGQDGGNLVTSITAINGTVFTLADGASADVTNVNVKHDDTIALQSAINTGKNVFWSSGNYNFDVLTLSIDNVVITFDKDVIIKSENKQDNLATGAFEIKGTTGESVSLTNDALEDSDTLSVDDASIFSIGDFIELTQDDPEGDTLEIHKQKYIRAILSVKEINGNIITVNEVLPHSFQVSNSAKARLINPVKNIRINGNNTIFDKMGTTEYCSHFLVKYAYNTKINGFECINGGGKGVDLFGSYTFKVDDITHSNPTNVTPGHGYGVHIGQGSSFGEVNDVKSRDARHCVDISGGSNNCRINNSTSFSASSSAFSGHGMNTKNIVFSNCVSYGSAFSVGNSSFLSDEKYKFINCEVYNSSGGFSVVAQSSDVEIINCKTLNCETAIFAADGTEKINLYNTEINFSIVGGLDLQSSHVSGENIRLTDSIIKIRGNANEIELKNIISNERVEIYDNAKNITISGLKLRGNPTRGLLVSGNVQFLNLFDSDCDLESTSRVIDLSDVTVTDIHLKIINSNIKTNGSTAVLCGAKNVYLINNNIQGSVSLSGDGDYTLMSNLTSGNISITSTTTTLIKDNISTSGSWTVPTDNGNDLIVKDNII